MASASGKIIRAFMFCNYCGTAVSAGTINCPKCGQRLTHSAQTVLPGNVERETSGKAIGSFVCGLFFFILPAAIVAVILGHISRSEIRRSDGRQTGAGLALTGLVLGYLGVSVIPIFIISAIAIPKLLTVRQQANAAVAVANIRSLNYALEAYASRYPQIGYPNDLGALGPSASPSATSANLVDDSLANSASRPKHGYLFTYTPGEGRPVRTYALTATPIHGVATRYFYTDQSGGIRYNDGAPADANSPLL
jgi:type II secretory pathway pseudopilin PulG